jgi:predicted site-specific integrase-resolvase
MENKYVNTKKAKEILGVHILTLYNWEKQGKLEAIRTPGGHRMYNVEKYLAIYGDKKYEKQINQENEKQTEKIKTYRLC